MALVAFVASGVAAALMISTSEGAAVAVVGAGVVCACLMIAPTFWVASALLVFIPFQHVISFLLAGDRPNPGTLSAPWEVVVVIGIFRVLNNPNRRHIIVANRWVLFWGGLLMICYCVALLQAPTIPAIYSLNLDTRFLGVLLFFMFLPLNDSRTAAMLRIMLWSLGLLAAYGVVQYFWDYERLLPFLESNAQYGLYFEGKRRLFSYSLNAFEPAYGAVMGILILFSRAVRHKPRVTLCWIVILFLSLVLTYTRSGYVALLAGAAALCVADHRHIKRVLLVGFVGVGLLAGLLLFGANEIVGSSFGERIGSIFSLDDSSSVDHKNSMRRAVELIAANPLGIGLGKSGTIAARFEGPDNAEYTENWTLQAGEEAGVFAALAFLGLTATLLWSLFPGKEGARAATTLGGTAASIFAAMTVAGVMTPVWGYELTSVYAWALAGMALATRGARVTARHLPPVVSSYSNGSEQAALTARFGGLPHA